MDVLLFQKILLSLAIGALVGMERERHAKDDAIREYAKIGSKKKHVAKPVEIWAGFRTFMLISLFGVLTSHMTSIVLTMWPLYIGIVSVAVLAFMSYYLNYEKFRVIGMTTEIAFFLTYIIGVLLYFESTPFYLSISLGIILTIILFFREALHRFAYGLTAKEIRDAIVFAALLFIIYPLLPRVPIGPFSAINLSLVWESMLVVMFVSFASYVAMRILGDKLGLGVAGIFGGMASSTSVALMMAEEAKKNKNAIQPALFAIVVSSSTMFFRMIIVSLLFGYLVGIALTPAFLILSSVGYVLSYIPLQKVKKSKTKIKLDSPIAFRPILQFTVLFTIVLFTSHVAKLYMPSAIYVIAILSGLFDVDAINISLSSMAASGLIPFNIAVISLIMAALSNTVSKAAIVRWIGGEKIGKEVARLFSVIVLAGLVALFIAWNLL